MHSEFSLGCCKELGSWTKYPLIRLGLVWAETSGSLVLVLNWPILIVVLGTRLFQPIWKTVFINRVHLLKGGADYGICSE